MPKVEREIELPVAPEEAWEVATERADEWLGEDALIEPWEGGEVRAGEREGVVEEVDPGRRLRWSWEGGDVVLTVAPAPGGGARVTVVETARPAVAARLPMLAAAAACVPA